MTEINPEYLYVLTIIVFSINLWPQCLRTDPKLDRHMAYYCYLLDDERMGPIQDLLQDWIQKNKSFLIFMEAATSL